MLNFKVEKIHVKNMVFKFACNRLLRIYNAIINHSLNHNYAFITFRVRLEAQQFTTLLTSA